MILEKQGKFFRTSPHTSGHNRIRVSRLQRPAQRRRRHEKKSDALAGLPVSGVLSDEDAEKYGVQVYFSDGAKKFAEKYDKDKVQVDAEGNKVIPEALKIPSASTAMEKANAVKNTYALENFRITPIPSNGNLLVYLAEELTTPSKMLEGTPMAQIYKKDTVELYWKNKLPAVYNITVDALCTVSYTHLTLPTTIGV